MILPVAKVYDSFYTLQEFHETGRNVKHLYFIWVYFFQLDVSSKDTSFYCILLNPIKLFLPEFHEDNFTREDSRSYIQEGRNEKISEYQTCCQYFFPMLQLALKC